MSCIVFVGPTLPREAVASVLDAICLPPAAQGDVHRAARSGPKAIGLIDGVFEGIPSVWHKEILWALAQGIHVFGAASMGALRAAELHSFGMRGVGRIFEAYRDGTLEDDDDVAVLHGPAETGYMTLSEAMVNVSATLEQAAVEALLEPRDEDILQGVAKRIFYQDRTWDAILAGGAAAGLGSRVLDGLAGWLPSGYVDRKRGDALALLDSMRAALEGGLDPFEPAFSFEYTAMWDDLVTAGGGSVRPPQAGPGFDLPYEHVLDELRLDAAAFAAVRDEAFTRHLALAQAERCGLTAGREATRTRLNALRLEHDLATRGELGSWIVDNDVDVPGLERLAADEARVAAVAARMAGALRDDILSVLRRRGAYARLAVRARDKARVLADRAMRDVGREDVKLTPPELLAWFFGRRLGQPIPDDPNQWARAIGFATTEDCYRLLRREYIYLQVSTGVPEKLASP